MFILLAHISFILKTPHSEPFSMFSYPREYRLQMGNFQPMIFGFYILTAADPLFFVKKER